MQHVRILMAWAVRQKMALFGRIITIFDLDFTEWRSSPKTTLDLDLPESTLHAITISNPNLQNRQATPIQPLTLLYCVLRFHKYVFHIRRYTCKFQVWIRTYVPLHLYAHTIMSNRTIRIPALPYPNQYMPANSGAHAEPLYIINITCKLRA